VGSGNSEPLLISEPTTRLAPIDFQMLCLHECRSAASPPGFVPTRVVQSYCGNYSQKSGYSWRNPVFRGTRVPVQVLFDYLEGGETLEDFLA
jgi:hypothetical protein